MKKAKDQFRIKDLRDGNYVQNGTQYHWASLPNAISAVRQRCNGNRYYDVPKNSKIEHYVIEKYELILTELINPTEIVREMEIEEGKQSQFYKSKQEEINEIYKKISRVAGVPDMKATDIKKLITTGILNEEKTEELGRLFDKIDKREGARYKPEK